MTLIKDGPNRALNVISSLRSRQALSGAKDLLVDLVLVIKDADGKVDWAEIEDQEDDLKEV